MRSVKSFTVEEKEMIQLKRILFPTDSSRCADQAFTHAVHLARKYQAEIHMLHAIVLANPTDYFRNIEEIYSQLKEIARAKMSSTIEAHKAGDLKIEQIQLPAVSAGSMSLSYAAEYDIDLIVMGTHGRRGLGHLLLGSIAEEVVRSAPCPVMTVRERKEGVAAEKIERILVPVDFSEHSRKSLTYAKELALSYGARLQLLHIIEEPIYPPFYLVYKISPLGPKADIEGKSKEELERFLKEAPGPDVEADMAVTDGRAANSIVKFAEKNASDLIVIATHGLTGFEHMLLGSVAEKVVRFAPCPVFTIKAFGKSLIGV
jgi:nucleotide-binding universal stress UspA family protein